MPTSKELTDLLENAKHNLDRLESREELEQFAIRSLSWLKEATEIMESKNEKIKWCAVVIRAMTTLLQAYGLDRDDNHVSKMADIAESFVERV